MWDDFTQKKKAFAVDVCFFLDSDRFCSLRFEVSGKNFAVLSFSRLLSLFPNIQFNSLLDPSPSYSSVLFRLRPRYAIKKRLKA
jgi:hypothetical protein